MTNVNAFVLPHYCALFSPHIHLHLILGLESRGLTQLHPAGVLLTPQKSVVSPILLFKGFTGQPAGLTIHGYNVVIQCLCGYLILFLYPHI